MLAEAMAKVRVGERMLQTASEGNGPVSALDGAVRKALLEFFPSLSEVRLVDYKVRIIDSAAGSGASIRVLMESTDGGSTGGRSAARPTSSRPVGLRSPTASSIGWCAMHPCRRALRRDVGVRHRFPAPVR